MKARHDKPLSEKMAGKADATQRLDAMLKMPEAKKAPNQAAMQLKGDKGNPNLPSAGKEVLEAPNDAPKGRVPTKLSSSMPAGGLSVPGQSMSGMKRPSGGRAALEIPGQDADKAAESTAEKKPATAATDAAPTPGKSDTNATTAAPTAGEQTDAAKADAADAAAAPQGDGADKTDKPSQDNDDAAAPAAEKAPKAGGTPLGKINPVKVPASMAKPGTPPPAGPAGAPMPPLGGMPGMPGGAQKQDSDNIWQEIWGFMRAIFVKGEKEQQASMTPMQAASNFLARRREGDPQAMQQGAVSGLFAAMDAPLHGLTVDDIQFANEVDAALARRPRFGVRMLSVTVALMFLILLIWAALADVDEVTHAEGSVVGSQRTQTIQNLEGGILKELFVREGQFVEKGARLAEIDNEMAGSSYRDAQNKTMENILAITRLEAELENQRPEFPKNLNEFAIKQLDQRPDDATIERAKQIVKDQMETWKSRQIQLKAEIDVLESQYEQRKREVQEQSARKVQLEKSLELSTRQRDTAESLLKRNNFSRMEFLDMEQKVVDLQGQVDMLDASIPKAEAAATEAKHRIASRQAEQRAAIYDEINKRRLELISLRETVKAGADRVTRTLVEAPTRGTIKQIHINTLGGVIKPGEAIMDIVPMDETLLVEAKVLPKDVAFLAPGQDTMIKLSAYDFNIYGGLEGKLESISADTVEDKKGEFHYIVKVRTPKTKIVYHNEELPIIPGMLVTADIMIGKKTILDYLIKPIMKAKQNALRER